MSVTCAITWSYGIWGVRFLNVYQQLLLSGIHDKVHFKGHTIKPGTPKHGTRNTSATPEHWWNTGTLAENRILAEQSEYNEIVEHVKSSGTR